MLRLGGSVIGFDNPQNSSVSKGENLVDTITIGQGVGRDQDKMHSFVVTECFDERMNRAPVFQIPAKTNGQMVE